MSEKFLGLWRLLQIWRDVYLNQRPPKEISLTFTLPKKIK